MISWVTANYGGIVAALLASHAFAIAVVNLTPTPADNAVVAKLYTVLEWVAGIITSKAKQ